MINHEKLRQSFKPDKIKVLFIAEAPPEADTFFYSAKSFFYLYTKQAFEVFFKEEISHTGFLEFFKNSGFYLDDLCHFPATFSEIQANKNFLIKELKERLNLYKPKAIIITPKRIDSFVHQAVSLLDLSNNIDLENIFTLYFAGNGWQNKYISGLKSAIHSLIRKNILKLSK